MNGKTVTLLRKFCRIKGFYYPAAKSGYRKLNAAERAQMHEAIKMTIYQDELKRFIKPIPTAKS